MPQDAFGSKIVITSTLITLSEAANVSYPLVSRQCAQCQCDPVIAAGFLWGRWSELPRQEISSMKNKLKRGIVLKLSPALYPISFSPRQQHPLYFSLQLNTKCVCMYTHTHTHTNTHIHTHIHTHTPHPNPHPPTHTHTNTITSATTTTWSPFLIKATTFSLSFQELYIFFVSNQFHTYEKQSDLPANESLKGEEEGGTETWCLCAVWCVGCMLISGVLDCDETCCRKSINKSIKWFIHS